MAPHSGGDVQEKFGSVEPHQGKGGARNVGLGIVCLQMMAEDREGDELWRESLERKRRKEGRDREKAEDRSNLWDEAAVE